MSDSDSEIEFNIQRNGGMESPQANDQEQEEDLLIRLDPDQDEIENDNAQGDHMGIQGTRNDLPDVHKNDMISPITHNHTRMHNDAHYCHRHVRSITIKPDTFNGDDDWDQYISHFENCAELGQWTERERALTLAACLKGQARVFYSSLPARDVCDYKSLITKLEHRFGSARQQTRWLSRLQSRRRLPHESIASFGDDIRLMAQKAYPSLDICAQEMLALQQFYKAISLEMRCRLMDKDTKSISEAVDLVERYEEVLGSDNSERRRNVVRSVGQTGVNQSTKSAVRMGSEIEQTLKGIIQRLERLETGQYNRQINKRRDFRHPKTCFVCNSPDHFYRDCPNNQEAGADASWRLNYAN